MFTTGFAEVLVDILTVNPAIAAIPSASAILDTSNYTFNALSVGKDSNGFKYHGHTIYSTGASSYNDGFLTIRRYNSLSPSSYHTSATHLQFSSTYSSIPNYPTVYDTRLERLSTATNVTSSFAGDPIPEVGHYMNVAADRSFSALWNVVGGFPPAGNTGRYRLLDSVGTLITSGNLSGVFNSFSAVDTSGFIKLQDLNATATAGDISISGPFISVNGATFSSTPTLRLLLHLRMGDLASLAGFGGVNHVGVWCLDIKSMLTAGLNPPYAWNPLNNSRKYKLVAKATLWNDLLHHDDLTALGFSGFNTFLVQGINNYTSGGSGGPYIILEIQF